jgi:hypothetical protein
MAQTLPRATAKHFSMDCDSRPSIVGMETTAQEWMQGTVPPQQQTAVTPNQITSLNAMVAYVAAQSGQSEFRIERSLSDHFGVPNSKCLPMVFFDDAIRYLVDVAEIWR